MNVRSRFPLGSSTPDFVDLSRSEQRLALIGAGACLASQVGRARTHTLADLAEQDHYPLTAAALIWLADQAERFPQGLR